MAINGLRVDLGDVRKVNGRLWVTGVDMTICVCHRLVWNLRDMVTVTDPSLVVGMRRVCRLALG